MGRQIREWRGGPRYNKVGTIGKGAFATVYKLTAKYDGVPYAAKELEKRRFMKNGVLDQKVDNEMKIMQRIKHVCIQSPARDTVNKCSQMWFNTLSILIGRSISISLWSLFPTVILAV